MRNKLIILLIVLSLFSAVKLALTELSIKISPVGSDDLSLYEKRFDGVKSILVSDVVIGYVTDLPGSTVATDPEALARFYIAQYAIAPVVIVNTSNTKLVLGVFNDVSKSIDRDEIKKLTPRLDFGNGIILFSNEAK